ncbi:MAG: hypothetical protein LBV18_03965 [Alistipes sp.]|jgi:hypothetical protein|nr:hypothetical protein [Alistipes sp.]
MKKYIYIGIAVLLLLGIIGVQQARIRTLRQDRDVYRQNMTVLLDSVERYQTREGLNAATVRGLELKLSEFKKYRADDAALIGTLRTRMKDLERVTTAQTATIYELSTVARDSVVIREEYADTDTLTCVEYRDPWIDFEGCIDGENRFTGRIESRDSLVYVEHVEYKRFLGFLWRTKRVKERRQEIVSRNPHTTIQSAEFITIRD